MVTSSSRCVLALTRVIGQLTANMPQLYRIMAVNWRPIIQFEKRRDATLCHIAYYFVIILVVMRKLRKSVERQFFQSTAIIRNTSENVPRDVGGIFILNTYDLCVLIYTIMLCAVSNETSVEKTRA